jgi:hypothetical protein
MRSFSWPHGCWVGFRPVLRQLGLILAAGGILASGPLACERSEALGSANSAIALTPTNSNPVQALLIRVDAAANTRDVKAVMDFYSPTFRNSDGLTRDTVQQSLSQMWQQYPNLTYRTELVSVTTVGRGIQAETVTYVTGNQVSSGRNFKLAITLRSRQRWEDQKLQQQDVLAERTQLSLGENPPTVKVSLPETLKPGQNFTYEAIVQEPLNSELLMGEVWEEPVTAANYLNPTALRLELPSIAELLSDRQSSIRKPATPQTSKLKLKRLKSGGFFKLGQAAATPGNVWLSAVLMRHDAGLTIVTQRLRVLN